MNLMAKTTEFINFDRFATLLNSIRHSSFDNSILTLVISLFFVFFFQGLSGSVRKFRGANQNDLRSKTGIQQET